MNCPNCGKTVRDDAKFCSYCRQPIQAQRTAPAMPNPAAPQPRVKVSPSTSRKPSMEIGNYAVTGVWRNNASIYWVNQKDAPRGTDTPRYLSIEMPELLSTDHLNKLRSLAYPNLVRVIDQARDKQNRCYLIVDHVQGDPLDLMQDSLGPTRAAQVFEKILKTMFYLHLQGWVIAAHIHQSSHLNLFWRAKKWIGGGDFSAETNASKRFQQSFALGAGDELTLFDLTTWEAAPVSPNERAERIQRDKQLTVGMFDWLRTAGRVTKASASRVELSIREVWDPTVQAMGEMLSGLAPKQEPGKTIPLPRLTPSAITRRLPLTKLASVGMTDNGKQRDHNEDNFLAQPLDAVSGLFVVADGMGGHEAGEVASKMAIEEIYKNAIAQWSIAQNASADSARQMIEGWITDANAKVFAAGQSQGSHMGTTITAALVVNGAVYAANVGDSRTYLFRSGQLYPLTRDHSLVASLVQAGLIKPEEIYTHPQRNQIFRSLGQQKQVNVDVFDPVQLAHEDRIVLCCDGLWEMVHPPEMENILRQNPDPQVACAALIRAANTNGGEDNITVVIVRVTFE